MLDRTRSTKRLNMRGDTLVEVLVATVLLSVVLAGAYTLSNRATRINQQAFERSQISNYMQQQAELIRSARDLHIRNPTRWNNIVAQASNALPPIDQATACADLSTLNRGNAFHIERDFNFTVDTSIETIDGLYRIWNEMEWGVDREYVDVNVYGCWESFGSSPTNTSALVIRLDVP